MEKVLNFFHIRERKSTLKTELLAGVTTFLAMAYIIPVNVEMLGESGAGIPDGGIFFATIMASVIAAVIMGMIANYPVALAPGMGINAFFTYTVVFGYGLSWQAALAAVLISGVLFLILTLSGLRRMIINAIPQSLKYAVGAGIGFFITFIGLKNAGIVVANPATLVGLGNLAHPTVLLGIFGLILVVVLYSMGNRFSLIIAILTTAIVGLVLGWLGVGYMPAYVAPDSAMNVWTGVRETFGQAFIAIPELFQAPQAIFIIFTFLFVDFFDTAGTLIAVGNRAGLINEEGELVDGNKALMADSVGTIAGGILGTSTVTSYIESSTGIEQGGRTGLTALTVAGLFLLSLFMFPFISIFSRVYIEEGVYYSPVTSMALVMVGALMVTQLKDIDWKDKAIVIPSFLTIVFMIFTFSIAEGIAIGFIFYPIVMVATKRRKEVHPIMYGLFVFFVIYFILNAVVV